jgi:hypothetical protein
MTSFRPHAVFAAVAVSAALALPALHPSNALAAQELGAFVTGASSPNPELPAPRGFGVYGEIEVRRAWIFRLTYARLNDDVSKTGTVCQIYSPRIGCGPELVDTSSRLGGLRLGIMRSLHVGSTLRLAAGGGLSFNSISADAVGESGRPADLLLPKAGHTGYQALVTLGLKPLEQLPLRLSASVGANWVRFVGCSDPEESTGSYDPFCGTDRFDEVRVGLSYILPRMAGW